MIEGFNFKEKYNCDDLCEIISILRAPGGCPWDSEQTHETLREDLIEETYEVVEAINKKSPEMLREELGDLLLQVVFHSDIARSDGIFNFNDVCDEICKKMITRHPHVFGEIKADTTEQVLTNWDAIKMQTKNQSTVSEVIDKIPREFPALMRAQKVQKKAAKVGFDWDDVSGALAKVHEEADEVAEAITGGDKDKILDETGDLFFAGVNVARFAGVSSEEALTHATDKFARRFAGVEKLANERGIDMKTAGIEVLDKLWDEVKAEERQT